MRHGGAQGGSAVLVQGLQQLQEAIAAGGQGATGDRDAAGCEVGSDFLALPHVEVALQSGPSDQVVPEALPGRGQFGELLREEWRSGAARALEPDFPGLQRTGGERGKGAGLGLLDVQFAAAAGAVADGREEVDQRQALGVCLQGAPDALLGPGGRRGARQQQDQQAAGPPFSATCWRS